MTEGGLYIYIERESSAARALLFQLYSSRSILETHAICLIVITVNYVNIKWAHSQTNPRYLSSLQTLLQLKWDISSRWDTVCLAPCPCSRCYIHWGYISHSGGTWHRNMRRISSYILMIIMRVCSSILVVTKEMMVVGRLIKNRNCFSNIEKNYTLIFCRSTNQR